MCTLNRFLLDIRNIIMVEQFWYDVLILPEYILFVTAASHFHVSFSFSMKMKMNVNVIYE